MFHHETGVTTAHPVRRFGRDHAGSAAFTPQLERLEERAVPAVFIVTNTNDAGVGSLRDAISAANVDLSGPHQIEFNIGVGDPNFVDVDSLLPGGDAAADVFVITPLSALPALSNPSFGITIDGSTQTANTGDTNPFGPEIVISGSAAGNVDGLSLATNSHRLIDLNIHSFQQFGVRINGSSNSVVGSYIGSDATGTVDLGNTIDGVLIDGGSGNQIGGTSAAERNVISGNDRIGVSIFSGGSGNQIQGNFIGTTATGTLALSNTFEGVHFSDSANNLVGGTAAGAGNVISGNTFEGLRILGNASTGNIVQGNIIGADVTGTVALGNSLSGVVVQNAPNNTIGGTGSGAGNLVSGNTTFGIVFTGVGADGNIAQGNLVGTDITGTANLGNGFDGVLINFGATNSQVGGTTAAARNVIAGNRFGVFIDVAGSDGNLVQGNFIGTDVTGAAALGNSDAGVFIRDAAGNTVELNTIAFNGTEGVLVSGATAVGNTIKSNSIFSNAALGIDLSLLGVGDGPTANDAADPDGGPNNLQNFSVFGAVRYTGTETTVSSVLDSNPNTSFRIEFFSNAALDSSGFGEGQTFLGFATVTTNASGFVSFQSVLPVLPPGTVITATATNLATGDTSEFSGPFLEVDIEALAFGSTSANKVVVTYEVSGGDVAPFSLSLVASADALIDGSDASIAQVFITDPLARTVGSHMLEIDVSLFAAQLIDPTRAFILAFADAGANIAETDELNNARSLLGGVFVTVNGQGVLVVRGQDDQDPNVSDPNDVIGVFTSGDQVIVSQGMSGFSQATAASVSQVLIFGYGGNDEIVADPSFDRPLNILAGNGNDTLRGGIADDTLNGGSGDDVYLFESDWGADIVVESAGGGVDRLDFSAVDEAIFAQFGFDEPPEEEGFSRLQFDTDFIEVLVLTGLDDVVQFGDGATFGAGSGSIDGGAGFDLLDYSRYSSAVNVDFGTGQATGTGSVSNFEEAIGASETIATAASEALVSAANETTGAATAAAANASVDSSRRFGAGGVSDPFFNLLLDEPV